MRPTRLLVADDHQLVREGIRSLLDEQSDMEVVAEADNGTIALRQSLDVGPDVVLMDVSLPEMDGIEATRRIASERPDIKVIVLTMYDDAVTVDRALRAGARGFVLKGNSSENLANAIRAVRRGEVYLSPGVSDYVLQGYLGGGEAPHDALTDREHEVLKLVAEGFTSKEIAEKLGLRPKTVQNHRARIMEKLGISTTAGLVRFAIRQGLVR